MSDANIGSIISLLGTVFTGVMAYMMYKLKVQQEANAKAVASRDREAAVKTEAVKAALDATNESTNAKLDSIHTLTNGMKTELVEAVRQASFAAGETSERDKDKKEEPK